MSQGFYLFTFNHTVKVRAHQNCWVTNILKIYFCCAPTWALDI